MGALRFCDALSSEFVIDFLRRRLRTGLAEALEILVANGTWQVALHAGIARPAAGCLVLGSGVGRIQVRGPRGVMPMPVLSIAVLVLCQMTGKVVSITDGDTLIVRESPTKSVTVRLVHIDAPERGQAFGTRARQALGELAYGKEVEIAGISKDRYGRTLGEVFVDGKSINLEMVRLGFAWAYVDFSPPVSYMREQAAAKMTGKGLWADRLPEPPWEYRKRRRTAAK